MSCYSQLTSLLSFLDELMSVVRNLGFLENYLQVKQTANNEFCTVGNFREHQRLSMHERKLISFYTRVLH